jgi:RNA polymerase sigma-70 factor (ECF subfamily)
VVATQSIAMGSTAAELGSNLRAAGQAANAADGLPGSLAEIYLEYAPLVWRGLRRLGVGDLQLEDAVQDVFLIVHRRLGDFEGRSTLKTWIYGIAVRVAKDHRRSERRYARRVERLALRLASDSEVGESPYDSAERREASQLLYAILSALPEPLRDVLVLVELEELSAREAAQALGIRLRTCQRRLQAASAAVSASVNDYLAANRRFLS